MWKIHLKAYRFRLFPVKKKSELHDPTRHQKIWWGININMYKKSRDSRLLFSALKQWKSNDIPSIWLYYAMIIVVYYKQIQNS